jgi:transposase InsO family protein
MSSRIPPRVRQAIIEFPADSRRGGVTRFCTEHHVSVAAFYKIRARAALEGPEVAALPLSTAPSRQASRVGDDVEDLAVKIRADLTREGWDAGPLSVAFEMRQHGVTPPSRATLARIFTRRGVVTPQPQKKPRSAWHRFVYPDPNGCWQLDGTEYTLDNTQTWCVLQVEDDHSRFILASLVAPAETSDAALAVVAEAIRRHGAPARFLTDNGTAFNQSRRGTASRLEKFLKHCGVTPITGRPSHPTTQGKNERLHQTLQKFLDAHRPIWTRERLATLVTQFEDYYNTHRPHQGLAEPGQTPANAYQAKPKALPAPEPIIDPPTLRTPHGPYQNLKGSQPLTTTGTRRQADRPVYPGGVIAICGYLIHIGRHRAKETMHVVYDDHTITVIDSNGVILGHTTRPPGTPDRKRLHLTTETPTSTK